mmetsp:Transcript_32730/g.91660  ORF Transcript_32730/g.91660 Transcript_32730/m.91660 type:complete len:250 (-) Transcript_32730:600-1349(-)
MDAGEWPLADKVGWEDLSDISISTDSRFSEEGSGSDPPSSDGAAFPRRPFFPIGFPVLSSGKSAPTVPPPSPRALCFSAPTVAITMRWPPGITSKVRRTKSPHNSSKTLLCCWGATSAGTYGLGFLNVPVGTVSASRSPSFSSECFRRRQSSNFLALAIYSSCCWAIYSLYKDQFRSAKPRLRFSSAFVLCTESRTFSRIEASSCSNSTRICSIRSEPSFETLDFHCVLIFASVRVTSVDSFCKSVALW